MIDGTTDGGGAATGNGDTAGPLIVGITGLRIACPNAAEVRAWYERHLGLQFSPAALGAASPGEPSARFPSRDPEDGSSFDTHLSFVDSGAPPDDGVAQPFEPGTKPFLLQYRTRDVAAVAKALQEAGTELHAALEAGGPPWFIDPEGQRAELVESGAPTNPTASAPERGDVPPASAPLDGWRVEGFGGVFFRSPDPTALKTWYAQIGIRPGADGYVTFPIVSGDGDETMTVWEIFPQSTTYFDSREEPSPHPFMLNLRVKNLDRLVEALQAAGVWVDPKRESYEYGSFAWTVDPTGARVELWEPAALP